MGVDLAVHGQPDDPLPDVADIGLAECSGGSVDVLPLGEEPEVRPRVGREVLDEPPGAGPAGDDLLGRRALGWR
jgi:hypothetical protein